MPTTLITEVPVGVINVPTGVGRDAWEACFRLTAERTADGVFGINETFSPAQRNLYRRLSADLGLGRFGIPGPNPVFWDQARWELVRGSRRPLHAAGQSVLARRWPGFNAAREATEVVLEDRQTGEQIAVVCTHWVPQGPKVPAWWRDHAQRTARRRTLRIIRRHLRAGRAVLLLGDFNVYDPIDLADRIDPELGTFQWIRGRGIDKVGLALPRGHRRGRAGARTFKAPTDHHHGVAATATWTPR